MFFMRGGFTTVLSSLAAVLFVRGSFTTVLCRFATMFSSLAAMLFVRGSFTTVLSSLAAMLSGLTTVSASKRQERGQCQYQKQFFHVQFLVAVDQSVAELRLFQRQIQVSLPEWLQQ